MELHYTQKTTMWMAHNVVHLARMLRERPIPPEGNTVMRMAEGAGHLG